MQQTPSGVADVVSRDGAGASRDRVETFTVERDVVSAWPTLAKGRKVAVYSGEHAFEVAFGDDAGCFSVWVREEGLEAIVGACMAALVRARIAREQT